MHVPPSRYVGGYEPDDYEYDDVPVHHEFDISGYGGLGLRGSTINKNPSLWIGAHGGIIFGQRLSIGGAFYEVTYRHGGPIVDSNGKELGIRAAYGGMTMGIVLSRRKRFELSVDTLIGGGAACISREPGYQDDDWRCIEAVRMFVTEPSLSTRFILRDWFRVGLELGYRFVAREAWRAPNDFQLSGPFLGTSIDFGWFK